MIDYKKIVKSKEARLKILRLLCFIPDEVMISEQYRMKTGRKPDLENPQRFTEKIQWYKLHYKNPLMIQCVDKADVREYVISKGLEKVLIPCYGIYNSPKEINWESIPSRFVMKDTLGCGGDSVVIVPNKYAADISFLNKEASKWIRIHPHVKDGGREWPYYSGKKHRIIIEQYLDSDPKKGGLVDYKFVCMNGKTSYIYVMADREIGNGAGISIRDENFNALDVQELDERPLKRDIQKPENFEELKKTAELLAADFPEVRVDLYDNNGTIRFGEMTFYDASGYMRYDPDEFDYEFGEKFILPKSGEFIV